MKEVGTFLATFLAWVLVAAVVVLVAVATAQAVYVGAFTLAQWNAIEAPVAWAVGATAATVVMMLIGLVFSFLTVAAEVKEADRKAADSRGPPKQGPPR